MPFYSILGIIVCLHRSTAHSFNSQKKHPDLNLPDVFQYVMVPVNILVPDTYNLLYVLRIQPHTVSTFVFSNRLAVICPNISIKGLPGHLVKNKQKNTKKKNSSVWCKNNKRSNAPLINPSMPLFQCVLRSAGLFTSRSLSTCP